VGVLELFSARVVPILLDVMTQIGQHFLALGHVYEMIPGNDDTR
jgi:hypothetical protein